MTRFAGAVVGIAVAAAALVLARSCADSKAREEHDGAVAPAIARDAAQRSTSSTARATPHAAGAADVEIAPDVRFSVLALGGEIDHPPLAGVRLTTVDSAGVSRSSTSDAEGRAEFVLATGSVRIDADRPGRIAASSSATAPTGGDGVNRIYLDPAALLRLRVLDAATDAPVSGADIEVFEGGRDASGVSWGDGRIFARGTTDAQGAWRRDGILPLTASSVEVRASGFALTRATFVPLAADGFDVVVRLPRGGAIHGVLLDTNGLACAGAQVAVGPDGEVPVLRHKGLRRLVTTDTEGRYRAEGLDLDGFHDVVAERGLERTWVRDVRPTAAEPDVTVNLRFAPPCHVTFHVLDAGGGELVEDHIDAASLDEERLEFSWFTTKHAADVSPGRYRFSVRLTQDRPGAEATAVLPPRGDVHVRLRLPETSPLVGRVLSGDGAPRKGERVRLHPDTASEPECEVETDETGAFRFAVPKGRWVVWISDDLWRVVETPCDPIEIVVPAWATLTVRLPPEARGRQLQVMQEVKVAPSVEGSNGDWELGSSFGGSIDEDFEMEDVAPGSSRLVAHVEGFVPWTKELDLRPGEHAVVDVGPLDPGVRLAGCVTDGEGRPIEGAGVTVVEKRFPSRTATTDRDGRFADLSVPAGRAALDVVARGWAYRRVVLDAHVGTEGLEIRLFRGGTLDLRVADGDGRAVVGHRVHLRENGEPVFEYDTITTDHRGRFSRILAPGRWTILVAGAEPAEVTIADGATTALVVTVP